MTGQIIELDARVVEAIRYQKDVDQRNRKMWRQTTERLRDELASFDYETEYYWFRGASGERETRVEQHAMAWKVQNALSALVRAIWQVHMAEQVPEEDAAALDAFLSGVLALMRETQEKIRGDTQPDTVTGARQ